MASHSFCVQIASFAVRLPLFSPLTRALSPYDHLRHLLPLVHSMVTHHKRDFYYYYVKPYRCEKMTLKEREEQIA